MIALNFRIKLLLAMMLLVAGVTGATLYGTQQKVKTTYQKLFQDQFEAEVNYFTVEQESRLSPTKASCLELARLPALHEALAAGEIPHIYEVATNFLSQQNQQNNKRARIAERATARVQPAKTRGGEFFYVLDAQGSTLHTSEPRYAAIKAAERKRLDTQFASVFQAIDRLGDQTIGYLAPGRTNGAAELLEVIVTKVIDTNNQTIGAVVVGVPYRDTSEKEMSDFSQGSLQSGIWLENQLHSKTIPENVRAEFSQIIRNKMKNPDEPGDSLNVTLGGVPRQLFFKLLNPGSPFPPAYQVSMYSMASALKTERELRWQILAFSSAALAAALVLSLFLAHGLSIPLRELVKATVAVRGGDFTVKVPVRSRDEVGELAKSFNEMAEGLEQKERYRTVLNMVADEKVAHALVNGQLELGGEVREISVLFCDIRGFTAHTENMPPGMVIEMLNEHMSALTRIVKENNGVLDKFVGDLLMAIFGAPVSHETDTLNAARCALQLIAERERLNTTSRHQLQIGISIATGEVVAGCMGSADRLNYTVLGERVNLASRLCSQASAGQVIIDETTREKLGAQIKVSPLPPMSVKGFSENVVAYELIEVVEQAGAEQIT